jgi:drug/metabolite transporter (DMT)-like permease
MGEKLSAYLDLTVAMAIAGSAVVVSKMMVARVPVFLATELGIAIGLILLLLVTFVIKKEHHRLDKKTVAVLLGQALAGIVLYRVFIFWGLQLTSAANSGLISSSGPAIVVILAFLILKENISKNNAIGLAFVIVGLLCINLYTYFAEGALDSSVLGNFLILIAVIGEGLFSVLSKIKCIPMSPVYRTTLVAGLAFICLLPFASYDAWGYPFAEMSLQTILCIGYYGIFVSFISYVLWFRGIAKVAASNAAIFTSVVPVSSIILAAILLNEKIQLSHLLGMSLIVCGILIATQKPPASPSKMTGPELKTITVENIESD